MNKKVLIPVFFFLLTLFSYSLEPSVTYFNSLVYGNTVLYGDTAWDHMDQLNMYTGIISVRPLVEKPRYGSRVRVAFDQPLWARIRQLDGEDNIIQIPGAGVGYGMNLFTGLDIPLETKKNLFLTTSAFVGPTMGFQALTDSFMLTLGLEGGIDADLSLPGNWSFVTGTSLRYDFWGLHTAGDTSRYDVYIKRGWIFAVSPGFRYTY